MLPIPKNLLIHTVTLASAVSQDSWGKTVLTDPVTLAHVRVDPSHSIAISKDDKQLQLTATLFYDCKNSSPHNQVFEVDNIIVFNSKTYRIKTIEPLYDDKKLHHYEIGLM